MMKYEVFLRLANHKSNTNVLHIKTYTLPENYPFWSPVSSTSLPCSQSAVGWRHSWHWFSEMKMSHTWHCERSAKPNNTETLN